MKNAKRVLRVTFVALMIFCFGLSTPVVMALEGDAAPQQNASTSGSAYTTEIPYSNSDSGQTTDSATLAETSTESGVYVDSVSFMMGNNSISTSSASDSETASGAETSSSGLVDSSSGTESSTTVESGTDSSTSADPTAAAEAQSSFRTTSLPNGATMQTDEQGNNVVTFPDGTVFDQAAGTIHLPDGGVVAVNSMNEGLWISGTDGDIEITLTGSVVFSNGTDLGDYNPAPTVSAATVTPFEIHTQALAQNMVVTLDGSRNLVSLVGTHVNTGDVYTYEGLHFRAGDSPLGFAERILCNADGDQVIGRVSTVVLQGGDSLTYTYPMNTGTIEITRRTPANVLISRLIMRTGGMWARENYTSGVVTSIDTSSGARVVKGIDETVVTSAVGGTSDTFISDTNTTSLFAHKISSIEVGGNGRIILRTDNPRIYGVYKILPSGNLKFEYVMEQHDAPNENVRVLHGESLLTTQDGTQDPLATITQTTKGSLTDKGDLGSLLDNDEITKMDIDPNKAFSLGSETEVRVYSGHLDVDAIMDHPTQDLLRRDFLADGVYSSKRQLYDGDEHITNEKIFHPTHKSPPFNMSSTEGLVINQVNTYNGDGTLYTTITEHAFHFNDLWMPIVTDPTDSVHESIQRVYVSGRLVREQRITLIDERVPRYGTKETTVFYSYDVSGQLSSKAVYEGLSDVRVSDRLLVTTNYLQFEYRIAGWTFEVETDVYRGRSEAKQPVPMYRLYDENHRLVRESGYHDQVSGENTYTTSFMLYDESGDLSQIKIYSGLVGSETAPQGATPPVLLIENYKKYQDGEIALSDTERYINGALDSKTYYALTRLRDVENRRIPAKDFQIMKANVSQGRPYDLLVVYEYSAGRGVLSQNATASDAWAQASTNATITVYSDPAETGWKTGEELLALYKPKESLPEASGYKQQSYSPTTQIGTSMFYYYRVDAYSQTTAPLGATLWTVGQMGYSDAALTGWSVNIYGQGSVTGWAQRAISSGSPAANIFYGDDMNRSSQVPGTYTGGSYLGTTVVVTSNLYGPAAPALDLSRNDYQYFVNGARPGEIMTITYQGGTTVRNF